MESNITTENLDAMLAHYARLGVEQRLHDELQAGYRRLHRRAVGRRAVGYTLALLLVGLTASAAMPAMEYDYITGNHAVVPAATIAGVRSTLAAL